MEIIGCVCSVSPNGNYVVLSACKDETTEVWDSEPMAFLWNVKKG
jgi:WD40 repeat protein